MLINKAQTQLSSPQESYVCFKSFKSYKKWGINNDTMKGLEKIDQVSTIFHARDVGSMNHNLTTFILDKRGPLSPTIIIDSFALEVFSF